MDVPTPGTLVKRVTTDNTLVKRVVTGRPIRRVTSSGSSGATSIFDLQGVSASGASNGDLLVYNEANQRFEATDQLEEQNVNGGQY